MRRISRIVLAIAIGGAFAAPAVSAPAPLLQITGEYFAYSYDLNQLYGENVAFEFLGYKVGGRVLKISLSSRSFCVFGEVVLATGRETITGDEFWFSAEAGVGVLLSYGEVLTSLEIGGKNDLVSASLVKDAEEISLAKIRQSMIYFTARKVDISRDYQAFGYEATIFLEGIESVGFKKIDMTAGLSRDIAGLRIEKVWFNKSQGLIARLSHAFEKEGRISAFSSVTYEERSILKTSEGPRRQFDLMTSWSANLRPSVSMVMNGNYNSSNLWNMNAFLTKTWGPGTASEVSFAYNKPVRFAGEGWVGLQSSWQGSRIGNLAVGARVGNDNQLLGRLSYSHLIFRRINLYLTSSYSRLRTVGGGDPAKIWTGNISLSYVSGIFNLATDYFLNRDLVGQRRMSQPRLQLAITPRAVYGGILNVRAMNMLIFNESLSLDSRERSYSNNLVVNIVTSPIDVTDKLSLTVNSSLEQFTEKNARNFVTGGIILNIRQEFSRGVSLEGFYSAQSRRRARGWMVEGTTSQDMSAVFRVDRSAGLSAWLSLSYDPKYRELRNSFADLSFRIVRAWEFHALGAYDFQFKKVNNVDLYIIRKAGRFQLRFVWRSLSRQFLVELIPQ